MKGYRSFITLVSDVNTGNLLEVIDSHKQDEIIAALKQQPIEAKRSKYKHLGKAGLPEHIDAVIQVARRGKIDALQRAMSSLYESWLSLYEESQPESTPPTRST